MLDTLGLERAVIVQPSFYGTDNRATLDAIRQGGPNFRDIVVVDEDIDVAEMERMHDLGVRGVRINLLFKSGIEVSDVRKMADKIAPFGYNLFVVKSITGRGMGEVSMSVLPFLILSLIGLMIITYIPQVALFFPTVFMG